MKRRRWSRNGDGVPLKAEIYVADLSSAHTLLLDNKQCI